MALLNPPELRASMMCVIVLYLAQCRAQRDTRTRIVDAISPPSLSESPSNPPTRRQTQPCECCRDRPRHP